MAAPLEEEFNVQVDSSLYQTKKKVVKGESYETLRYSFKPSSVKNQPGVLWKQKERVDDPVGTKVFVEFKGDESKVVEAPAGGKSPVLAEPVTHIFEGTMQEGSAHDCLLIVDSSGNARLELLSASAQLKKITSGTVPSVRPGSMPGHVGAAGGGGAAASPAVSDESASDSDESDSSAEARPSPVIQAAAPAAGGGGKGLLSSGGKGLLSAGGKGLMTLQQAQSQQPQQSSSSSEDDSEDEDSD
ncbi:hypothetical protein T484DRAFT_1962236 [Baffinella frigidus]|nr:hypothetical protein T484DRAFT_1962236 [Cryptophyta sp. CCMP2293]